jgi:hypothetical protein
MAVSDNPECDMSLEAEIKALQQRVSGATQRALGEQSDFRAAMFQFKAPESAAVKTEAAATAPPSREKNDP